MGPIVFHNVSRSGLVETVCLFDDPTLANDAALLRVVLGIQGVVTIVVMVVNAFTMAAIWPRRHRRCTQSSLFVLHLALADLLVGLSKFINVIFTGNCDLAELAATHEIACLAPAAFGIFSWTLSATTLAAIAVDRYVCIVHSLRYYEFMKTRRVILILAGLWVLSICCSLLFLPTWEWQEGRFCREQNFYPLWHLVGVQYPISILVLFAVAATHLSIRSVVRRSEARAKATQMPTWLGQNARSSASVRSAKIVLLVVGGFIMGGMPMMIFQALLLIPEIDVCDYWGFICVEMFSTLWYLLNPFIYAWKNASIREDMTVLWLRITSRLPSCLRMDGLPYQRQPVGARRF